MELLGGTVSVRFTFRGRVRSFPQRPAGLRSQQSVWGWLSTSGWPLVCRSILAVPAGGGGTLLGVVCITWCLATLRVLSWLVELLYILLCEEDVDADICPCLCPLLSCMFAILLLIS